MLHFKEQLFYRTHLVAASGITSIKEEASLRPVNLLKQRLWHKSFPVKFAKFLRTPFSQNTYWRLRLVLTTQLKLLGKKNFLKNLAINISMNLQKHNQNDIQSRKKCNLNLSGIDITTNRKESNLQRLFFQIILWR